jgi:excisionase family DNA binding protein
VDPLLSPKELAAALGIAEQTIYNRHSGGGDLPPCLKLGRLLRFRREDVEAWLMRKLSSNAARQPQAIQSRAPTGQGPRRRGRPTIAEQLAARRAG